MQAQEFYAANNVNFEGIGDIIESAYGGYDDSTAIMVIPENNGQVDDIDDQTVMNILGEVKYDHFTVSPNPAIRTTAVGLYGERKGILNAVQDPDDAQYMVVTTSAVIDLARLDQDHGEVFEHVHQVLNIKADQNQVKADAERQAKIDRRAKLQAELDALDEDLGLEE
ncbi:MAG: hypothetical protein HLX51_00720 [Micrococcaceae bacterium]|nr:hypothetical protein [Micrococcaceae bacterium]